MISLRTHSAALPLALTLAAAALLLAASPAHSADYATYAEGAKAMGAICPGLVKNKLPHLTARDSDAICGCVNDTLNASGKDYTTTLPTNDQWRDMGVRATLQCIDPYARKFMAQQCMANASARQEITRSGAISDSQFDRYCTCNANVVFDEAAKGANLNDPNVRRAVKDKTDAQCVAPMRGEKPAR